MRYTEQQLELALKDAVAAQTPNTLPDVLRRVKQQEGRTEDMDGTGSVQVYEAPVAHQGGTRKKPRRFARWAAAIAAVLVLAAGTVWGVGALQTSYVVSFDVNPSVQLRLNSNRRVLSATPLNPDAEVVLGGMDLKNVDLDVAVNALIGAMLKNGYITSNSNTVLISVQGAGGGSEALQQQLVSEVNDILSAASVEGAVLGQRLGDDQRLDALARQYGITPGKAALIELLVSQDPLLDFAELAALPVNDIYLLITSRQAPIEGVVANGQPASGSYIGEARASEIALAHAGFTRQQVAALKVKLDYDDGRMQYEVEFSVNGLEYEYELDAVSGEILKVEQDADDDHDHGPGRPEPEGFIGGDSAKAIALEDAGLSLQQVEFVKFTWYEKQGVYRYDMIFLSATHKYSYEVNAITGEIIAKYTHGINGTDQSRPQQNPDSGAYIGEAQAKAIALAHAGVAEANLTRFEIELKRDDGRMVYEVEFKAGGMEYDYEIDALTGDILDWEAEPD